MKFMFKFRYKDDRLDDSVFSYCQNFNKFNLHLCRGNQCDKYDGLFLLCDSNDFL